MHLKFSKLFSIIIIAINCCFFSNSMAQKSQNNFSSQWKKVENFQKKGLTKSALHEVETIYNEVLPAFFQYIRHEGLPRDLSCGHPMEKDLLAD